MGSVNENPAVEPEKKAPQNKIFEETFADEHL